MGGIYLTFDIHVVEADVPILLSLADMDRIRIHYNNLTHTLHHNPSGASISVSRQFGHPFIKWNNFTDSFFSESELRRLHKRFGHPTADKLLNLLKRSDIDQVDSATLSILEEISRRCRLCQFNAQRPRRFKFSLKSEKDFNQQIYVDVMHLEGKPVLHVVDEATRYQAARWLPDVGADTVWNALRLCWIDVYIGPPDVITHDAAKYFLAESFRSNSSMLHIATKPVPVESPNSMTYVERYHVPLRRAFKIMKAEAPNLNEESLLQSSVKAINDSVGPDGLVPTLLVYGALPRLGLPTDKPTPSIYQRARAVRKTTEEMSKYFAKRQVTDALR